MTVMVAIQAALGVAAVAAQLWLLPRRRTWGRFFRWERTGGFLCGVVVGLFFAVTQPGAGF